MAELTVPSIDFSPIGQLGQVYQKAQADQLRQQTLAGLGQGPVDSQALKAAGIKLGDMSLLNLGVSAETRAAEAARQAARDKVTDSHWQQSFGLQQRAAARADEGPVETAAQRAQAAGNYGIQQGTPEFKAYVLTGKLPEGDATVVNQVAQRKQAAAGLGMTPDNPGYQSFVLTGKMPREDAQPLTATDKKAILEADEGVLNTQQTADNLRTMRDLSGKAYSGPTAGIRGKVTSLIGNEAGEATVNLENLSTANALSQLKSTFGAAPTEGERKILLDIQGSVNQPDAIRQEIYKRADVAVQRRMEFNKQRAAELRGGSFYKPGAKSAAAAPTQGNGADTMIGHAREALAAGAPREAVIQRLQAAGIDPSGL